MIHPEIKVRITTDAEPVIAELEKIRQYSINNPMPVPVELVIRVDTDGMRKRVTGMAVALTAALRQISNLEDRLAITQRELKRVAKRTPKRPARKNF